MVQDYKRMKKKIEKDLSKNIVKENLKFFPSLLFSPTTSHNLNIYVKLLIFNIKQWRNFACSRHFICCF